MRILILAARFRVRGLLVLPAVPALRSNEGVAGARLSVKPGNPMGLMQAPAVMLSGLAPHPGSWSGRRGCRLPGPRFGGNCCDCLAGTGAPRGPPRRHSSRTPGRRIATLAGRTG